MNSKNFKESKTYKNIQTAFIGESQARNKYTYYASKARKEGFVQISEIFEETANNEKEHAKIWFKLLNNHIINSTQQNLEDAISGEHYEISSMYPEFSRIAKEEDYGDIAELFERIGKIEQEHEECFIKLLKNLKENNVFNKETEKIWICSNCGYSLIATSAPNTCPVCIHSKAYFKLKEFNY